MKKNLLFTLMATILAGFGFGGVSMAEYVATTGENCEGESPAGCYETLVDAFAAVQDGETITLLKNCSGNGIVVPSGKKFVVDFSGFTYTIDGDTVGSQGTETNGFQLLKDSTLTFKNGIITSTKAKILIQNYSNLTLYNMKLDGTNLVGDEPYTLSTNNGKSLITNNSEIIAKNGGIAFDVYSFDSYTSNEVTVENSKIIGKIEQGRSNNAPLKLNINEGTELNGEISVQEGLTDAVITKAESVNILAPEGYIWGKGEDNSIKLIVIGENVARVDSALYPTLVDAFAAVQDGETITLLKNCSGNGIVVPSGKKFVVDFSGFTYTIDGDTVGSQGTETNGFQLLKDSTLTFKNGIITSTKAKILIQNYSNLTLDNMKLDGTNLVGDEPYTLSTNNGKSLITNNSEIIAKNGGIAFDVYSFSSYTSNEVTVENSKIIGKIEQGRSNNAPLKLNINEGTELNGEISVQEGLTDAVIIKAESVNISAPEGYIWDNNNTLVKAYTITLGTVTNGTISADSEKAKSGAIVTLTATPNSNYNFSKWTVKSGDVEIKVENNQFKMPAANVTVTATFTSKPTSSGGGSTGGGGSSSSSSKTTTTDTKKIEETKTEDNASEEINLGGEVTEESTSTTEETSTPDNGYSKEFNDAYTWAFKNGITTMSPIEKADMNAPLTRIAMAKMLSQYAINVLGRTPDTTKVVPAFPDVSAELDAAYNSGVTLAYQLGIMGINIDKFRPDDLVTRAEFGTALSRMLYATADGEKAYYETHLAKLMEEKIITVDTPDLQELRGYVMIMLMRSANK